jgi:hypothetical protein
VTSTAPDPAGETTLIDESFTTVIPVAAVEPNRTAVAPVKPDPEIVTEVPPAAGPELGLMAVTDGEPGL